MRQIIPKTLAITCLALATHAAAAAQDADPAALARVERYLDQVETLKAEFSQEVVDRDGTIREQAEGVLYLQKPGRFRWDYRAPLEQQLVSDGKNVWLYDVELEQVTVREVGESLSTTPAMLLSGQGKVADSFSVAGGESADGLDWILLTPIREETDFRVVRLGFRGRELERMELEDRLGQTARIRFSAIERNLRLSPGLFEFEPPPGVDVVGSRAH